MVQVWTEAKEDSLWLVYFVGFIMPLHSLLVMYLESRGKRISSSHVLMWISSLTLFSTLLPLLVRQRIQAQSPYRLLGVSRYTDAYTWAQVYAAFKQHFTEGKLAPEAWSQVDAAYDILYDQRTRQAHDAWGPDFQVQLQKDMAFNVGLYYMIWTVGVYIATAGRKYQTGRDLSIAALLVTLVFELTVRFFSYDPRITLLAQTTPYELVMALHVIFPACLLGYNSWKRLVFVDMLQHRNACLQFALRNNEATRRKLGELSEAAVAAVTRDGTES
ncbi:hypothetical protein H310_13953 [Aphanomyces invadans]|uniref:J domain-containing protein n=1 Tax=Aphanomyces invadans TaxID=157072 RepID=A0A024TBN6_9STRA|nr:hypothetical protein H310_13953 [Aphanomyces invadans]ETV91580.1 hypothetical protein H310_13953 [Aphanomyces invadans]|eukprot:XP_008879848.1 hypothetical protein H310_13953 [Aphanomyces invadans]